MSAIHALPKEGDLYKTVKIEEHTFELRFGFYEDFERNNGDPVVIYPDLNQNKLYTKDGRRIVTAIQDPCEYYTVPNRSACNGCCSDCAYFSDPEDEIGICSHSGLCMAQGDSDG
ncbi:MAG: hypothetical protein E7616_08815 [Ruminococcaceae bacterium]|nr:hypothetical protein [Oscillospiraceae bacterium]